MSDGITQLRLDDGTVVWARVSEAQELRPGGGYQDSALSGRVTELASGLADTVRGVVRSVRMGMAAAAPDEVTVEFGLELAAQEGKLVSLLANAQGTASINVTLTWTERGGGRGRAREAEAAPEAAGAAEEPRSAPSVPPAPRSAATPSTP
ncbi:CU044_2847 family protein [Streptomyces sp. JJ38]|uniref:CU044_2847 family protein n=1 Tax=Streptomyces sp. JJ38 TaxID=2738128 RepID=UPI0027E13017|nr:CU044_2847 family protein [Streptomyces sp. JJ38]